MTYRIRTLAAVAAFLSVSLLAAPSADAVAPRGEVSDCATPHEFDQVRYNATRRETQALLDGPGRHPSVGINHQVIQREYRLCGRSYDHGRLIVRYSRATDRLRAVLWIETHGGSTLDRG